MAHVRVAVRGPLCSYQRKWSTRWGASEKCHVWTSNTSPLCSVLLSTESPTTARQLRGATTHGEVREVKLGGFSAPTQDVSGASGAPRNDTITAWAQGDAGETKCPTPGMLMMVA